MQPWLIQQHWTLNNPQVLELFLGQDRLHKGAMFESKCIHAASYRKKKNTWKTEQLCAFPLEACFCWLNPLVESPCFVEITIYIYIYIWMYIYIYRPPWSPQLSRASRVSRRAAPGVSPWDHHAVQQRMATLGEQRLQLGAGETLPRRLCR